MSRSPSSSSASSGRPSRSIAAQRAAARQRAYRRNLRHVLGTARLTDWTDGAIWYRDALAAIVDTATLYGLSGDAVAGIVAALSPRQRWESNIADAVRVISGREIGRAHV